MRLTFKYIPKKITKANENKLINADINRSLNILKKYIKNSIPNLEIGWIMGENNIRSRKM